MYGVFWIRRHWLAAVGAVPLLLEARRWAETLLLWGEHSEFVLHRMEDVKMIWNALIAAPPQWINIPLMIAGFVLIWLDVTRSRRRKATDPIGKSLDSSFRVPGTNAVGASDLETRVGKLADDLAAKSKELSSLHSDRVWFKRILGNLLDALHVRDVEARFKTNDEIVWRLGLKLLRTNPPQYNDPDAWLSDYRTWREALATIDAAKAYLGNRDAAFLDVAHALENCLEMPPNVIAEDGNTIVPYKTVYLAFREYERHRERLAQFFEQRGTLPESSNIP